jgi:hypothetical protein
VVTDEQAESQSARILVRPGLVWAIPCYG